MMRWLLNMLRVADKHQLKWEVINTALSLEFPPDEAERQIDTLVAWRHYAGLLTYDDSTKPSSWNLSRSSKRCA